MIRLVIAIAVAIFLVRAGMFVLRSLATPIPEPPPPGELRRVNLRYRCALCGTEARLTLASDQIPEPPRHCMEEMELTTNPDDL
ncbi:MAG TPA: hypothetical protein VMY88_04770 [Acidimicrobiales bacterium]|nr:hypothetical protein [Acidimicrobiales bacterium]